MPPNPMFKKKFGGMNKMMMPQFNPYKYIVFIEKNKLLNRMFFAPHLYPPMGFPPDYLFGNNQN